MVAARSARLENKNYSCRYKYKDYSTSDKQYLVAVKRLGQEDISNKLAPGESDYWWTHLAFISYKRNYLN